MDIDIDLAPSKIGKIFEEIRKERGELGLVQVCTFGTEATKSAIQTACRGYRSADYPEGIDVDESLYLSSLIPQERGFLWELNDVLYGNPDKGREPQSQFISAVSQYPGLVDIIQGIEGLIHGRGVHASGVILFDEDTIYDNAAIMRTPSGNLVTQWDLHDQEYAGGVKYDFLLTEVQDKIIQTIKFLQQDGILESDLTLRELYDKYLHPSVLPLDDNRMWEALKEGKVLNCFQFDSEVGIQAVKKVQPTNVIELSDANGLLRLMAAEKGAESPLDKYVRFKNNINLWYKEMRDYGLTDQEQKALEPYFLSSYGVPPSQEQLMKMLMDKDVCGFTLGDANTARKIVGKKQMDKIPALKEKVLKQAKSEALGNYVWRFGAGPQMGYSFSVIHSLAYSFIAIQTLYLATNFNPIYWNTACLVVNSGSLEDNSEEEIVDIYEPEHQEFSEGTTFEDLPDRSGKIKRTSSTDYRKLAKAIGAIRKQEIKVSLVDINKSQFGFIPDAENNIILFGMKGMLNVGDEVITNTIKNRPYSSPRDFLQKVNPNKQAMVSLIKGGAFDTMLDRKTCMAWYLWETCDKKKRITLQNMSGLIKLDLIPKELEFEKSIFEFTRYLKLKKDKDFYQLDDRATEFLINNDYEDLIIENLLNIKLWDTYYQKHMDKIREWMTKEQESILQSLNEKIFMEDWNKYALGSISKWEMEVLCFYYHDHELLNVDTEKYGIDDFFSLPDSPEVERVITRGSKVIPLYKLNHICGTCIAKKKEKGTVTLLTTSGVVDVKFRKEYFSLFDRQLSERGSDGVKHVIEKSWFNRGNMILVTGIREGDMFISKKYASTGGHQLYKIDKVFDNGTIELKTERESASV